MSATPPIPTAEYPSSGLRRDLATIIATASQGTICYITYRNRPGNALVSADHADTIVQARLSTRTTEYSISQARADLATILNQAAVFDTVIYLTRNNRRVAAVIPLRHALDLANGTIYQTIPGTYAHIRTCRVTIPTAPYRDDPHQPIRLHVGSTYINLAPHEAATISEGLQAAALSATFPQT